MTQLDTYILDSITNNIPILQRIVNVDNVTYIGSVVQGTLSAPRDFNQARAGCWAELSSPSSASSKKPF